MNNSPIYLHGLTHLRALAALAVFISHWLDGQFNYFSVETPLIPRYYGVWGVDIFFVISGVVMALIITPLDKSAAASQHFFARRLIRIVPAYWISILVAACVITVFYCFVQNAVALSDVIDGIDFRILKSFLFIEVDGFPINPVGWTLNYEMFFYLVCAGAVLLFSREKRLCVIIAFMTVLVLSGVFYKGGGYYAFISKPIVLEFVAGLLLGKVWLGTLRSKQMHSMLAYSLIVIGLACLLISSLALDERYLLDNRFWVWGAPSVLLVMGVLLLGDASGKGCSISYWLGERSYSIYLWHLPCFYLLAILLHVLLPDVDQPVLWYMIFAMPVTLFVANVSYIFLEQKLGYYLLTKLKQSR